MSKRLFGITDIHGQLEQLNLGLAWIEANTESAKIVFTGDYVDRGEDSKGVIERLIAGPTRPDDEWVFLMGNHEDLLVNAYLYPSLRNFSWWEGNGGSQTMNSYGGKVLDEHVEWMSKLSLYHETENYWFVHAGLFPNRHPRDHDKEPMIWMRYWEHDIDTVENGSYDKHVVYGHTPDKEVQCFPHCTCLDTAAAYGGKLTIGEFDPDVKGGPIRLIEIDTKSKLLVVKEMIKL